MVLLNPMMSVPGNFKPQSSDRTLRFCSPICLQTTSYMKIATQSKPSQAKHCFQGYLRAVDLLWAYSSKRGSAQDLCKLKTCQSITIEPISSSTPHLNTFISYDKIHYLRYLKYSRFTKYKSLTSGCIWMLLIHTQIPYTRPTPHYQPVARCERYLFYNQK